MEELAVNEPTIQEKLRALEAKRAARAAKASKAAEPRDLKDAEAIDRLEEEHGVEGIAVIPTSCAPPLPGKIVVGIPGTEFKFWQTTIRDPKATPPEKESAESLLVDSSVLYPTSDVFLEIAGKYHGLRAAILVELMKLSGLQAEAKGKG